MHKLIFLLFVFFIGCSASKVTIIEPKLEDDKLHLFFKHVKSDLNTYGNIALQEDLVKLLSHFKEMDAGGKRYYLIERENISRMIESSIQKLYSDYILLDAKGNVIYSKSNNHIFSNNISKKVSDSSLLPNLLNEDYKYYITEPLKIEGFYSKKVILVCMKISSSKTFPGFAILQIDIDKINSLLEKNEFVLNLSGNCLFANEIQNTDKIYEYFSHLEIDNLQSSKYNTVKINKKLTLIYGSFSIENINWIFVEEKNDSMQYKK
jgi:hypothetical protein